LINLNEYALAEHHKRREETRPVLSGRRITVPSRARVYGYGRAGESVPVTALALQPTRQRQEQQQPWRKCMHASSILIIHLTAVTAVSPHSAASDGSIRHSESDALAAACWAGGECFNGDPLPASGTSGRALFSSS